MVGEIGNTSESVAGMLSLLGILAILCATVLVLITTARNVAGPTRNPVAIGVSVLFFLSICLIFGDGFIPHLPDWLAEHADTLRRTTALLWWLAAALTVNAAIGRYIWRGRLVRDRGIVVPRIVSNLTVTFIFLLAAMAVVHLVFGKSITALAATSGAVAFVLGYSARTTLTEIFSGLTLHFDQPFRKGNVVMIDGVWGRIDDMNWRSVRMIDMDGRQVTIPNTRVGSRPVVNYERPDPLMRRTLDVTVEYGHSPKMVQDLMTAAMRESRFVLASPPPTAPLMDFTDLGIKLQARFWINKFEHWWTCGDEVGAAIWQALHRHGVRFAFRRFDTYTPHDPEHALLHRGREVHEPDLPALLHQCPPFDRLTAVEVGALLPYACRQEYDWPERIVRQGDEGNSIFVIAYGSVEVSLRHEDGSEERLKKLGPGASFGLMSLLTGEPRTANVRALERVLVYEIAMFSIRHTLQRRPEALQIIAEQVAEMHLENERATATYLESRQSTERRRSELLSDILTSMRRFLGLKGE